MIRWRFVGVALVMGATLLGCGPDVGESTAPLSWTVEVTPPSPTPTRTWTAQEQAAIDAVQAYLGKWTEIAHDPANADIDSIREVAAGDEAEASMRGLQDWKSRGLRLVGDPSFEPIRVIATMQDQYGKRWEVTGCYVITGTSMLDMDDITVPEPDRIDRAVMLQTVLQVPDGRYFVSDSEMEGDKSC